MPEDNKRAVEPVSQRAEELSSHGPEIEADHSIIAQLHDIDPTKLATPELLREMADEVALLAKKEAQLAKLEMQADVQAELFTVKALGAAAILAVFGAIMLLVALAMAISPVYASLVMGILLLIAAAVAGCYGWSKRVQQPLDMTRKTLEDDVRWAKQSFS